MSIEKNRKILEIHIEKARAYAFRLHAFANSVHPKEWNNQWNEIITPDIIEFSFHARKINEICEFRKERFPDIDNLFLTISEGDPGNWETDYHLALNAFVHMKEFVVGAVHADHRRIFPNSEENLISTYVKIKTDKFPEKTISIPGLVCCFLNSVIPLVREKFPEARF